jgi:hypothetical protein
MKEISLEERARRLQESVPTLQIYDCLAFLIRLEVLLRNNDQMMKEKLSNDDIEKLKGILSEELPRGVKTFLSAAIKATIKADLNPREALFAICDVERYLFRFTGDYERAWHGYREKIKAKQ